MLLATDINGPDKEPHCHIPGVRGQTQMVARTYVHFSSPSDYVCIYCPNSFGLPFPTTKSCMSLSLLANIMHALFGHMLNWNCRGHAAIYIFSWRLLLSFFFMCLQKVRDHVHVFGSARSFNETPYNRILAH